MSRAERSDIFWWGTVFAIGPRTREPESALKYMLELLPSHVSRIKLCLFFNVCKMLIPKPRDGFCSGAFPNSRQP